VRWSGQTPGQLDCEGSQLPVLTNPAMQKSPSLSNRAPQETGPFLRAGGELADYRRGPFRAIAQGEYLVEPQALPSRL
jgi:hypothetical protein